MCIFAEPVRRVSDTKIYVAPNRTGTRQLTVYEMKVRLAGHGNAMILPVPGDISKVELKNLSSFPDFFSCVEGVFSRPRVSRALGWGPDTLAVYDVGVYKVSLSPSIEELDLLDPSVFTVSEPAKNALRASHGGRDGGFIVAVITQSGLCHPLAYTHEIVGGEMFVPTRHEHGTNMPVLTRVVSKITGGDMADWDHDIYYAGGSVIREKIGKHNPAVESFHHAEHKRLHQTVDQRVSSLAEYIDPEQTMYHLHYAGAGNNTDLTIPVTAAPANEGV